MQAYLDICNRVLSYGDEKVGRNGKTISLSGTEFRHNMKNGFPILTIREMSLKNALTELRFFIQGLRDRKWLKERGNNFWNKWSNPKSEDPEDLGPIYGAQWRNFNGVDQLVEVLTCLRNDPTSRRMLVSAWNPSELDSMALPPCHDSFQLISNGTHLDLVWRQRSCDIAVGLPYDIILYGLLLELIAVEVNMTPRWLVGHFGDTHVYESNLQKLVTVLERRPKILPELSIPMEESGLLDFAASDTLANRITLRHYQAHPKVVFEVVA